MSYSRKPNYRTGLGGAENCGADQQWDPNASFLGIKGQCVPRGSAMTQAPADSGPAWWEKALAAISAGPAPAPVYVTAPSSGMSTTTMVAIGGAALLAIFLIARK